MRRFNPNMLHFTIKSLIYATCIFTIIVTFLSSEKMSIPPALWKLLAAEPQQAYVPIGSEFEVFRKSLPRSGTVGLLVVDDSGRHKTDVDAMKIRYGAQNHLAPLLVSDEPEEKIIMVYAPNDAAADAAVQNSGLRWLAVFANGKGIAIKP